MNRTLLAGQRLIAAELRLLPQRAAVLSVGEGAGVHVVDLAAAFPSLRFYACDLDPSMVTAAEERRRAHGIRNLWLFVADASYLPVRDRSMDFSYVRSVLQFLTDAGQHQREIARANTGAILYRDIGNWPFYPILRELQSLTLRLRSRPGWELVRQHARTTSRIAVIRRHARWYQQWFRDSGLFSSVRIVGHDLLWWDLDRHVPVLGSIGARFGLRCVVAGHPVR